MRILVIEDDPGVAEVVRLHLEGAGYLVDHAVDGEQGLECATLEMYDLIVLDLMLPKRDGWGVCEALRQQRNPVPILMLTARDRVCDRVRGLDAGADDYLAKPFEITEFSARVRALLRRGRINRARVIRVADLEIDTAQRRVWRGGTEIGLSRREFDLLEALAGNESRVFTRDAIRESVWNNDETVPSMVDVYISLLRKKIDTGYATKLIRTVHGIGYTLRCQDVAAAVAP